MAKKCIGRPRMNESVKVDVSFQVKLKAKELERVHLALMKAEKEMQLEDGVQATNRTALLFMAERFLGA